MLKIKFSWYKVVLVILIIINVFELFVPRMDRVNYFIRLPIQLLNVLVLAIILVNLFLSKIHWNALSRYITLFLFTLLISATVFFINVQNDFLTQIAPYLKLTLWLCSLIFFYEQILKYGIHKPLFKWYVVSLLISVSKKIVEFSSFSSDEIMGGDFASLALLLLVPLILLLFDKNLKIILLGIVILLIIMSLRRTSILGLLLILPFVFNDVRKRIKIYHYILVIGIVLAVFNYTWEIVGESLITRFSEIFEGDSNGDYGSGRSKFYRIVWDGWWEKDILHVFFGNGLRSVGPLLTERFAEISHAHNDFLEIGYTFGLWGVIIYFLFLYSFWRLRKQIAFYTPENTPIFYTCIISYIIIALTSGIILRITAMPFALTISLLYSMVQIKKYNLKIIV